MRLTQGSPPVLGSRVARDLKKKNRTVKAIPEAGLGAEGGRFTGSTDDSGPMKPGNPDKSGEDKTPMTRKMLYRKDAFGREPAV
jgi:hypothetical protein